jgi:NAD(P)-dependent dehydrogenase (short-subunit alcohol dehydrogenase family)
MSGRLQNKVALVTGAARGIGRATAVALAKEGADVIGLDIAGPVSPVLDVTPATLDDLTETGRQVEAAGRRWLAVQADQRQAEMLRRAAEHIKQHFGGLDVVFANAGVQGFKPLLEMTDGDWQDQIINNLIGTGNVLRVFAPMLVERGGGSIIVTSSTQGKHGTLNGASYSASKWGLFGLVKSAALELGKYRIRVNAVVPGLIDTPLTRHESRYAQALETGGNQPTGDAAKDEQQAEQGLTKKSPLGVPWIAPEDIAPAVIFLASDESRMMSGASIEITGGDSANFS